MKIDIDELQKEVFRLKNGCKSCIHYDVCIRNGFSGKFEECKDKEN